MPLSSARLSRDQHLQAAFNDKPALKRGAVNDGVKILQRALMDLGAALIVSNKHGSPDGIFGVETEEAVKAFQRSNRLNVDGIAGHDTLDALNQIFTAFEAAALQECKLDANTPAPFGKVLLT